MSLNIIHLISNKCWGGGERYALDLCRAATAAGHSVAAVTRGIEAVDKPFADAGISTGRLPLRGWYDLFSPLQLARILNRINDTAVLHVHNFSDARTALTARRLSRRPEFTRIVMTRHLARPAKSGKSATELYRSIDALVFVSDTARETFLGGNPSLRGAKNIYTVHNSLLEMPEVAPAKEAGERTEILYAGRIHPEKGLDVLIEALAAVTFPYHLTVAGTGPGRDAMAMVRLARKAGVDAHTAWAGHVPDLTPLVQAADVCVVPSRAPEAFGLALLEFMAAGKPVVSSDSGAQKEIVTDGTDGLLFAAGNAGALARCLGTLNDDAALRARLGATAARTARERFGYGTFYSKIERIYRGEKP